MTYFLRTERLGFRCWSSADLDLAVGLWGDPEVTRLIDGPFSHALVAERLSREIECQREHGVQYWPIFLVAGGQAGGEAGGQHVGCCGLRPYRPDERVYELGLHLRPPYWDQGYGREGAGAVIEHAFAVLGASALFAGHHPANEASRRLLGRLGFRYTHDQHYAPTGLCHPSYLLTAKLHAGRRQ